MAVPNKYKQLGGFYKCVSVSFLHYPPQNILWPITGLPRKV